MNSAFYQCHFQNVDYFIPEKRCYLSLAFFLYCASLGLNCQRSNIVRINTVQNSCFKSWLHHLPSQIAASGPFFFFCLFDLLQHSRKTCFLHAYLITSRLSGPGLQANQSVREGKHFQNALLTVCFPKNFISIYEFLLNYNRLNFALISLIQISFLKESALYFL